MLDILLINNKGLYLSPICFLYITYAVFCSKYVFFRIVVTYAEKRKIKKERGKIKKAKKFFRKILENLVSGRKLETRKLQQEVE